MNCVQLIGRLTKDVELSYTNSNKAVAKFTLAVNRPYSRDEVDFINIVAWEKKAEFCSKHYSKGRQVAIVGRIQVRSWDDNEGKKRYTTEVVANECFFADSKKEGQQDTAVNEYRGAFDVSDANDSDLPF